MHAAKGQYLYLQAQHSTAAVGAAQPRAARRAQALVFPLVNKDGLADAARALSAALTAAGLANVVDTTGAPRGRFAHVPILPSVLFQEKRLSSLRLASAGLRRARPGDPAWSGRRCTHLSSGVHDVSPLPAMLLAWAGRSGVRGDMRTRALVARSPGASTVGLCSAWSRDDRCVALPCSPCGRATGSLVREGERQLDACRLGRAADGGPGAQA